MKEIELKDVLNIAEYEKLRDTMRAEVIARKRNRRIELGPNMSLVLENRVTVLFQIQEMVRTERLVDDRKIQDEIDAYKNLIPGAGELSATIFIEIPGISEMSHAEAQAAVNFFQGFDNGGIALEVGGSRSLAEFESGFSNDEKMAAVQYVKFRIDRSVEAALEKSGTSVAIAADNGRYRARASVSPAMVAEMLSDLKESS